MRKKRLIFYFITFMLICQYSTGVMAISEGQKNAIVDHCDAIKDNLKMVQRSDARARVFLGGYYEKILSKYVMPLNVRLVENNLSEVKLMENQTKIATGKTTFANDFVGYQKALEELVLMDCRTKPDKFYDTLVNVRKKRKTVYQDVLKMRELMSRNVQLVEELRSKL